MGKGKSTTTSNGTKPLSPKVEEEEVRGDSTKQKQPTIVSLGKDPINVPQWELGKTASFLKQVREYLATSSESIDDSLFFKENKEEFKAFYGFKDYNYQAWSRFIHGSQFHSEKDHNKFSTWARGGGCVSKYTTIVNNKEIEIDRGPDFELADEHEEPDNMEVTNIAKLNKVPISSSSPSSSTTPVPTASSSTTTTKEKPKTTNDREAFTDFILVRENVKSLMKSERAEYKSLLSQEQNSELKQPVEEVLNLIDTFLVDLFSFLEQARLAMITQPYDEAKASAAIQKVREKCGTPHYLSQLDEELKTANLNHTTIKGDIQNLQNQLKNSSIASKSTFEKKTKEIEEAEQIKQQLIEERNKLKQKLDLEQIRFDSEGDKLRDELSLVKSQLDTTPVSEKERIELEINKTQQDITSLKNEMKLIQAKGETTKLMTFSLRRTSNNIKDDIAMTEDCMICFDNFPDSYFLECAHTICHFCLKKEYERSKATDTTFVWAKECPVCRKPPSGFLSKYDDKMVHATVEDGKIVHFWQDEPW